MNSDLTGDELFALYILEGNFMTNNRDEHYRFITNHDLVSTSKYRPALIDFWARYILKLDSNISFTDKSILPQIEERANELRSNG